MPDIQQKILNKIFSLLSKMSLFFIYFLRIDVFREGIKDVFHMAMLRRVATKFKQVGNGFNIKKNYIIINPKYITIGENFSAMERFRIEAWDKYGNQAFTPKIEIGDNVCFNTDIHIGCINYISIGNNVLGASRIYITDHHHGEPIPEMMAIPPFKRPLISKGAVIIKDNVWIGEGVAIMPGVTIGENSIIATNAVVTKDIPANSIAAGVPAKVIKTVIV